MACPVLIPQVLFGLRTDVKQNAHFITDKAILYPMGAVITLQEYPHQHQRHIQLMEQSVHLEMIVISPTRTMAAIILNLEKGCIVIYDLKTLKKKRKLPLPHDATTKRFEHCSFSYDEKLLLTLTGHPDWMMLAYNLEKGKVETFTRGNYINNPGPVSQVLCSPADSAICCIIGPGLFRLMSMQETVWRQYGFQKADQVNVTSATFLSGDRIIAGTVDGKLLLVDNGELKVVTDAVSATVINIVEKEEGAAPVPPMIPKAVDTTEDKQVRALISFAKGFAFSCRVGEVHMFEKENKNTYTKRNIFVIRDPDYRQVQEPPLNIVQHLSLNLSQDVLLATTNRSQIYTVRLWGPLISAMPEIPFKHLGESLHHGIISGLAVCYWKPVFMTCGAQDRTVRLWNYETASLEMSKQYQEDIYSVSLHPTGLFAAIGFTDKLCYMIVLLDDIKPYRVLPVIECHLSSFSSNGHYLAAVTKTTTLIYSTITFHLVWTLKGHWGKITSMVWTPDDRKLITCGTEGAVYEWDTTTGERIGETVDKRVSYWECSVTTDGKFIYAVGNTGHLREICQSQILRSFKLDQKDLPHVVLSKSDDMMFICGESGVLLSVKMPLLEPITYECFFYNASNVLKMKLTHDDKTLITVTEGGLLAIWNVVDSEGRGIILDQGFTYCMDLLIPKIDLEEKVVRIADLKQRIQELVMEHEFVMKEAEATNTATIQELHQTYTKAISELNERIIRTERDNQRTTTNLITEVAALREIQERKLLELETGYNEKLIFEYDKYDVLVNQKAQQANEYENKLAKLAEEKDKVIKDVNEAFQNKINKLEKLLQQAKEENKQQELEHEEIKQHIEDDADREIIELKADYENILREEREVNIKLRGELGVTRKKLETAQKDNNKFKLDLSCLTNEVDKSINDIANLQKDVSELKREIYERDLTIQDKEKRIYDMKKKTEELEKYKFVLSHKIEELKSQLEPKEDELLLKDKQISEMENELEHLHSVNGNMKVKIAELRDKLKSSEQEARKLKEKTDRVQSAMMKIKIEIVKMADHLQNFKLLKEDVTSLYDTYARGDDTQEIIYDQACVDKEFVKQREYLEHSVNALRFSLDKAKEALSPSAKLVKENVLLIEEVNELKKSLKHAEDKVRNYESILLPAASKDVGLNNAKKVLELASRRQEEIREEANLQLMEVQQELKILKLEVERLRRKQDNK